MPVQLIGVLEKGSRYQRTQFPCF